MAMKSQSSTMMMLLSVNLYLSMLQTSGMLSFADFHESCLCRTLYRRTYHYDVFDRKPDSVYVYVFLWGVQAGELIFMMCLTGNLIVCMFMCFCGVCRQEN